ncbi:MAG: protein phosphatase 2C domain-containing protein [Leptospiraceae bacterium]|nr:protein phosphatase 2C domain-containing protein [Leptospiraceae bacterium]
MKIEYFGVSNCGPHRSINQDSFFLNDKLYYNPSKISLTSKKTVSNFDRTLFAIADGMGGHNAGEEASQFVLGRMVERLKFEADLKIQNYRPLQRMIYELNTELNELGQKIREPTAGTTLSGVVTLDGNLVCFHVGDSRVYHYIGNKLEQITVDHCYATESGDKRHRNYLTSCVGGGTREIKIEIIDLVDKITSGSVLLLMTDGVTEVMEDDEFSDILIDSTDPKRFCQICIQETLIRDPTDNVTVVALRVS